MRLVSYLIRFFCVSILAQGIFISASMAEGIGRHSFKVDGVNLSAELMAIYLGDFENARLSQESAAFSMLFSNYVRSFGSICPHQLPENKIEIMDKQCVREQYSVNGYGLQTGPKTCVQYQDVKTGIYADPVFYKTSKDLSDNLIKELFSDAMNNGDITGSRRLTDELFGLQDDIPKIINLNGCKSLGLARFAQNMLHFAMRLPALKLDGEPKLSDVLPSPGREFKANSTNFVALIDDLIAENARGWMMNRYNQGSVTEVEITKKDNEGRPIWVKSNYTFNAMGNLTQGTVYLTFERNLPACLFFSDAPNTCRRASRAIVNRFETGQYGN